ncbi:hypothetical protein D3C81_637530 [compost metagenome]
MLALHHQGQWPQARIVAHLGAVQHGAARAHVDALADVHVVDLHHAVFEQMRLRAGEGIQFAVVADVHAVEFRDVRRIHVDAAAYLAAEQAEGQRQPRRAAQVAHEVGYGDAFVQIGDAFGDPDKRRPHGRRMLAVASQQQPLEQHDHQKIADAVGQAGDRQVAHHFAPAPGPRDRHHVQHQGVADGDHHGVRRDDAERFDQAAAQAAQQRRLEGQVFGKTADLFARGQMHGRRTEPGIAAVHLRIARRVRVHADQHVLGQHGAVGDIAAIADKAAVRNDGGTHGHPAAVDLLVAQHDGIGDEGVVAQGQHVRHHAQGRGNLRALADLGAQQAVPVWRVHGGVNAVQDVQARFLDMADQPLGTIDIAVHGRAARLQTGQRTPADGGRQQGREHDQYGAGGEGQQEVARQLRRHVATLQPRHHFALVEPVDQHEAGENGHEEQHGNQDHAEAEEHGFARQAQARDGGARRLAGRVERADVARGRTRVDPACRYRGAVGQRRLAFQVAEGAHAGIAFHDRVRADAAVVGDADLAQQQTAPLDPGVFKVDGIAHADVVADGQQVGRAQGHRADDDFLAHFGAQRAQPPAVQGRAAEQVGGRRFDQAVGQPPAVVGDAPQRIAARLQAPGDQPLAGNRNDKFGQGRE